MIKKLFLLILIVPASVLAAPRDIVHPLCDAKISSQFGYRDHPLLHSIKHHDGIDLPAPEGTPVRAIAKGIVIDVSKRGTYGNLVTLLHESNWTTLYAHLRSSTVKVGKRIEAGEIIGYVGRTGRVTGAHLHLELRDNGRLLNPNIFLPILSIPAEG